MKRTNHYAYRALTTAASMSPAADLETDGEATLSDRARNDFHQDDKPPAGERFSIGVSGWQAVTCPQLFKWESSP